MEKINNGKILPIIVEKKYLKQKWCDKQLEKIPNLQKNLEFFRDMSSTKTNVKLVVKMFAMNKLLKEIFHEEFYANIAVKCRHINKNIY